MNLTKMHKLTELMGCYYVWQQVTSDFIHFAAISHVAEEEIIMIGLN